MNGRVRRANVALSIPEDERDRTLLLREHTERRLIPNALNALNERLNARLGKDSVVLVRRLVMQCAPLPDQLSDSAWAEELGHDLAESLVARAARLTERERLSPGDEAAVVVLENPAHWSALCLVRAATRAPPIWFLERLVPSDRWNEACREGAQSLEHLIGYLVRLGALERVLEWLPKAELARALERLEIEAWPREARSILRERLSIPAPVPARGDPRSNAKEDDGGAESKDPRAALAREPEADAPGLSRQADEIDPEPSGQPHAPAASSADPSPERVPEATRRVPDHPQLGREVRENRHVTSAAATPANAARSGLQANPLEPTHLPPDDRAASAPALPPSGLPSSEAPSADVVTTAYGGLFYLLRLVLQLDLAEHLWCAGIPEGPMLTRVARVLLGSESADDAAPLFFGADGALAPVPRWAMEEVCIKSYACLKGWLVSRGIEPTQLVAPDSLAATFEPADAEDPCAAELASVCAALLVIAFCGALGEEPSREQLLSRIRLPARIELLSDVRIVMALDAIDSDVRRAGLDFNPGFVPWQRRKVQIVFDEG